MSDRIAEFFRTARERFMILQSRDCGDPPPWTRDPAMSRWFFCNVFREDDRVTEWLRENFRIPQDKANCTQAQILLWAAVGRFINRIPSLYLIQNLIGEDWPTARPDFIKRLRGRSPLVTGAYVVKTPDGYNKLDGIVKIMDDFWPVAESFGPCLTLESTYTKLATVPYFGSFMAYEVVSDLRWTRLLNKAPDIMTWANPGPGCCRGLTWVFGEEYRYGSRPQRAKVLSLMRLLLEMSQDTEYWPEEWPKWEMREVEHWLCEYDKWCRATHEGRPLKRKYEYRKDSV